MKLPLFLTLLTIFLSNQCLALGSKYAYVTIFYDGTPKDEEYILGARVLLKSLQVTNTQADFVILHSKDMSQSTKQIFLNMDCVLVPVDDIANPYEEESDRRRYFQKRFNRVLNKIHAWNLVEYERVIYLDADNIVLRSLDPLFHCGHFCAVYMNPVFFHTGLMVIKPSRAKYLHMLESLKTLSSYDGADQGFLNAYFSKHYDAKVFFISDFKDSASEAPENRLPITYNMHHIYFYEKHNWDLYRMAELANETIPALSIGFPIAPAFKPWNWYPYMFLEVHWEWQKYRDLLGDNWLPAFGWRLLLVLACVFLLPSKIAPMVGSNGDWITPFVSRPLRRFAFQFTVILISDIAAFNIIPNLMPPVLAIPLFIILQNLFQLFTLKVVMRYIGERSTPNLLYFAVSLGIQTCLLLVMPWLFGPPISKIMAILVMAALILFTQYYYFNITNPTFVKIVADKDEA